MTLGRALVPFLSGGLIVLACSADPLPSATATPAVFEDSEIRFAYPANWSVAVYPGHRRLDPIAYLSTAPMHDPCSRDAISISCAGLPVETLQPDGVLVMWRWLYPPAIDLPAGDPIVVGGRQAVLVRAPAACLVGDKSILIDVANKQGGLLQMAACLSGPDLDTGVAAVDAMLDSVVWLQP